MSYSRNLKNKLCLQLLLELKKETRAFLLASRLNNCGVLLLKSMLFRIDC